MMNMNNDKMFVCDQCIFTTVHKCSLTRHVKSLHNKIRNIKCNYDLCEYNCSRHDTLKIHIKMVHSKIKDFVCNYNECNHTCSAKNDLKKHIKSVHLRSQESKKMSLGEFKIYTILKKMDIEFTREFKFQDLKSEKGSHLRFDFGIKISDDNYLLLEFDGKQHFQKVRWTNVDSDQQIQERFEYLQKCDKQKNEYAKNHNYDLLRIRFDNKDIEKKITEYFHENYEIKIIE